MKQLEMRFRGRGGRRKNAGRKPNGARAGVSHLAREPFARLVPVHVTVRVAEHVYNLRSQRCFSVLARAFGAAAERFDVRIVQFSVMGNHVHLVVEASSNEALARAMKGFSVRVARGLNRVMGRRGRVLGDRYHSHVLHTPTETRRAVRYVRQNAVHHGIVARATDDRFASHVADVALPLPHTWLLRVGWRRAPQLRV
jgi:REP element-mobilizing transposase RayT